MEHSLAGADAQHTGASCCEDSRGPMVLPAGPCSLSPHLAERGSDWASLGAVSWAREVPGAHTHSHVTYRMLRPAQVPWDGGLQALEGYAGVISKLPES